MRKLARIIATLAAVAAVGTAIFHVGLLVYIIASRVGYPLDLEWMEGGMLCHALRILESKPIYGPPSADFISYLYTPFYPLVVAALSVPFELGYWVGRLVSIASFAGALWVATLVIRREVRSRAWSWAWGIVCLGLICCSFQYTAAWYDLVRNDSLYLLLVSAGLYLLVYHHDRTWLLVFSGVLMGLAFLTKQTASLMIVYSGFVLMWLRWRRLLIYVPTVGVVAGGTVLVLNKTSGGWFWRYIFEMHQGHAFFPGRLWPDTEIRLAGWMPVTFSLIGAWVLVLLYKLIRRRAAWSTERTRLVWFGAALVGVLVAALGFATEWAVANAYIPAFYFCSLFACVSGGLLAMRYRHPVGFGLTIAAAAGLSWQLYSQRYEAQPHIPTQGDWEAAEAFLARIKKAEHPMLVPYHPFYSYLAGGPVGYHKMGINDVTRAGYPFPQQIRDRIRNKYYKTLVFDNHPGGDHSFVLQQYRIAERLRREDSPPVVTGFKVSPSIVLVPKPDAPKK